jgi:exodeoxyribonuclease VII large subunit
MVSLLQNLFTVSELNAKVKLCIEQKFTLINITGQVSNYTRPASGHMYFTLKDDFSSIRCAFFKPLNIRCKSKIENGQQLIVTARVSLYEQRGDYQLIIQHAESAGDGHLQVAFEKLKNKLQQDGLFDQDKKQALPKIAKQLGIISSATTAALQDILRVCDRRFPALPIIIYPCVVQGDTAAKTIASAINIANARQECDVLIVARGGGSLEDLWPFNEEEVARAIYASKIPIITGIGHEIDTTIADFVADARAATPSSGAELATIAQNEVIEQLNSSQLQLNRFIAQEVLKYRQLLQHYKLLLRNPAHQLQSHMQQLDNLADRMQRAILAVIQQKAQHLSMLAYQLNAHSPLAILARGYAVITKDEVVIQQISQVDIKDTIDIRVLDGTLTCEVKDSQSSP